MKNDLKTFPIKASPQDYENWKKAFEKELKERKTNFEKGTCQAYEAQIEIKEILG